MESIKIEIKTEPELIINDAPKSEALYNNIKTIQQDQAGISPINTSFIVIKEEHEYDTEIVKINEQPVKCEVCGKGFKCEDIAIHMTLHENFIVRTDGTSFPKRKKEFKPKLVEEESVKCQFCGKGFRKEDLKIHESTHIKAVKSIKCTMCNICNKWFDIKEMERHMLNHRRSQLKAIVESKTKMCQVCGTKHYKPCTPPEEPQEVPSDVKKIKFDEKTIKQIEEDRKINQPEDVPVICKYCGKGFKSHDLKLHEGLHEADIHKGTNEGKKSTCYLCFKTFETKAQLNLHRIKLPKEGGGFYVRCNITQNLDLINK